MERVSVENSKRVEKAVSEVIGEYRQRGFFPSAAVRVFSANRTICRAETGDVGEDTVFDVASLTKIVTATQTLQAVHRGELRLTDGILEVMPELTRYSVLRKRLSDVTIYKLLTHTSKITAWYPFYAETGDFPRVLSIVMERCGPVEGMVYSDINFMLLGKVLETLYVKSLQDCLQANLSMPLKLGKMTYRPDLAWDIAPSCYGNPLEESMCQERGIVFRGWRPHRPVRGQANDGNAYYYFGGSAGSAGIFATAGAYEKLCRYLMKTDIPVLVDAQTQHLPTRGLGWQVGEMYPEGCGHTGFTGTSVYMSRKLDVGVVAFTNRLFFPWANLKDMNAFRLALHRAVIDCLKIGETCWDSRENPEAS
jgi:CubicO group peptidase (beta-lactamase class C family)